MLLNNHQYNSNVTKSFLSAEQFDAQNTKLDTRISELNIKYEVFLQETRETRETRQIHNDHVIILQDKQEVDSIKFELSNQADCIKSLQDQATQYQSKATTLEA